MLGSPQFHIVHFRNPPVGEQCRRSCSGVLLRRHTQVLKSGEEAVQQSTAGDRWHGRDCPSTPVALGGQAGGCSSGVLMPRSAFPHVLPPETHSHSQGCGGSIAWSSQKFCFCKTTLQTRSSVRCACSPATRHCILSTPGALHHFPHRGRQAYVIPLL